VENKYKYCSPGAEKWCADEKGGGGGENWEVGGWSRKKRCHYREDLWGKDRVRQGIFCLREGCEKAREEGSTAAKPGGLRGETRLPLERPGCGYVRDRKKMGKGLAEHTG